MGLYKVDNSGYSVPYKLTTERKGQIAPRLEELAEIPREGPGITRTILRYEPAAMESSPPDIETICVANDNTMAPPPHDMYASVKTSQMTMKAFCRKLCINPNSGKFNTIPFITSFELLGLMIEVIVSIGLVNR